MSSRTRSIRSLAIALLAGLPAALPAQDPIEEVAAFVVTRTAAVRTDSAGGDTLAVVESGRILAGQASPTDAPGAWWPVAVLLSEGWIPAAAIRPLELPQLARAVDSARVTDERMLKCPDQWIHRGEQRYLFAHPESEWGGLVVYLDDGCWKAEASEDVFEIVWGVTFSSVFAVAAPDARPCQARFDSLSADLREALDDRWPIVPASCTVFEVRPADDPFPGLHHVYQVGAFERYRLPEGFDEPALHPALVVDGAVHPWERVAGDLPFHELTDLSTIGYGDGYQLVAFRWRTSDTPMYQTLEVWRASAEPFRLERVFDGSWPIEVPPGEQDPYAVHPDGSITRRSGEVCTYDEPARTYRCRGGRSS